MKNVLLILFVIAFNLNAQEKNISGTVSDTTGPLPGVNIIIKGTSDGTQTDFDGNYTIEANVGDILSFSYIGYLTTERPVGKSNIINVTLEEDVSRLEEIVVTALGIKRERKALGYATASYSDYEHGRTNNASGQLTAGEINDLNNWSEWIKSLNHKDFRNMQEKWAFYLKQKIKVKALNQDNVPMANVSVNFYTTKNQKLFSTKTDALGEAAIFIDKATFENEEYFVIQLDYNGKILGKKITRTYENVDFVLNETVQNNDADIMFTIDATGSMGDEMSYLKAELQNIFDRLDKSIENKRVGLTFYRDHGDAFLVKDFDFNSDISKVKKILSGHNANGGGDYEEAVEEALKISLAKSWNLEAKSRILFLLLDAPPHYTNENVKIIQDQIKIAQKKGIKIIPIVASDANKNVEFLMRFFSVSTNGTYVFLTNDSGIGNDHMEPTNSKYKIEKLNDLIVRLINKYCGV